MNKLTWARVAGIVGLAGLVWLGADLRTARAESQPHSFADVARAVQDKVVKVYGAGGIRGLEAYQSGILISADGHVVTAWSYVLDTDEVTVVLDDGRRFSGALLGMDPRAEIALLKIDAADLPHFPLDEAVSLQPGARVLAFSNVFGVAVGNESASVQHGVVAARTNLSARRGAYQTTYHGPVYVLDAMTNNPGAAGGALTDRAGRLAGLLGKELRNSQDNTWLNFAIPIEELRAAINDLLAGKARPASAAASRRKPAQAMRPIDLGIVLVPDVLAKTPPYIDRVATGSAAAQAGLVADDLILFVNDRVTASIKDVRDELSYIDRIDEVRLLVQRGAALVQVSLFANP